MENSEGPREASKPQQIRADASAESTMNLALYDPPRFGWTAVGPIADLLPPHERARRRATTTSFRNIKRKRVPSASKLAETSEPTESMQKETEVRKAKSVCGNDEGSKLSGSSLSQSGAVSNDNTSTKDTFGVHPAKIGATELEVKAVHEDSQILPSSAQNNWKNQNQGVGSVMANDLATASFSQNKNVNVNNPEEASSKQPPQSNNPQNLCSENATHNVHERLLGVKQRYLGMEVKKNEGDLRDKGKPKYECIPQTLSKDNVLDMYAYHRGREGFEPRDPESGELRCSLPPTDTNDNYDAPRTDLKIVVKFPLHEGSETNDEGKLPVYCETVDWTLGSPTTPSPAQFANEIATEFGLNHAQMLNLAFSIQSQIEAYTQQNWNYCLPISITDPNGVERTHMGQPLLTQRFDDILNVIPGGTRLIQKDRQRSNPPLRTIPKATSVSGSTTSGRKRKPEVAFGIHEDVGDEYLQEVKRRSRMESMRDIAEKCANGVIGRMERCLDYQCHLCHKRCDVSYRFACGTIGHTYCESHCKTKFDPEFNPEMPISLYCPICTRLCPCPKCAKKIKAVAGEFKRAMEQQGTSLEGTKFGEILSKFRGSGTSNASKLNKRKRTADASHEKDEKSLSISKLSGSPKESNRDTNRTARQNTGRLESRSLLLTRKPPLADFPREIHGSVELEPATMEDYLRVYTARGTYLSTDFPQAWSAKQESRRSTDSLLTSSGEVVEDGNVDFCVVCQNYGNLLCCDFCPRAFHEDCLHDDGSALNQQRWECPKCKEEKKILPIDSIDTKKHADLVLQSFSTLGVESEKNRKHVEILSAIYEMITILIDYDFGYMFAVPVDAEAVPGYKEIIKNPMDLGTILKKLEKGEYLNGLTSGTNADSLDDAVTAALKDIELVWHNCFLFNFDGSAIHRMASVQRRRAVAIQDSSFGHLLEDKVKAKVEEFVKSCGVLREQISTTSVLEAAADMDQKQKEFRMLKPRGKHKVSVKISKPKVNRAVAIFDHVAGRLVKAYSSVKSASQAVQTLISIGNRCEFPYTHELMKTFLAKSSSEPSMLLFGYRWLMLDDLRNGKVAFHTPPSDGFQVRDVNGIVTYPSLEEALCARHCQQKEGVEYYREKLSKLDHGCEWTDIAGMMWRRLKERKEIPQNPVDRSPTRQPPELSCEEADRNLFAECSVVKEDTVLGRRTMGFSSIEDAFKDWCQATELSPIFPPLEEKTMEDFQDHFLNGERVVDGLVWKRQEPLVEQPKVEAKAVLPAFTVPGINGIMTSPLVSSTTKKRARRVENWIDSEGHGNSAVQSSDGKNHYSVDLTPSADAQQDGHGSSTPLAGVKLFQQDNR